MSELVLGTAQFGHAYGVTNSVGRINDDALDDILDEAKRGGITRLDTAGVYGDALERLRPWAHEFIYTSKIVGTDPADPIEQIENGLTRLGRDSFESCLIREWDALEPAQQDRIFGRMLEARGQGLVERIGVAAYEQRDIESFADVAGADVGVWGSLQVPANPLDRRLDESVLLRQLRGAGAEIAVRSVFLQGALLEDESRFSQHPDIVRFLRHAERQTPPSTLATCMAHAAAIPWASAIVVGVSSVTELRQITHSWADATPNLAPTSLASSDATLIDPRLW